MSLKKLLLIVLLIFFALLLLLVGSIQVARLLLQEEGEGGRAAAGSVGLVEIRGMILDSREPVRQLRHFLKKDDIKAVVVRIDSPGGGGTVSRSRRYAGWPPRRRWSFPWGAAPPAGRISPATVIYANPGTITASIGVLIKFSNIEGLMDKIGIKSTTVKTGTFKDAGSPSRPLSPEERAMFQAVIDSTHEQFVRAVAEGRKLPLERVRELADGRILSGEQAKVVGLVDKLGNQQEAIAEAGRLAGIGGEPAVVRAPQIELP